MRRFGYHPRTCMEWLVDLKHSGRSLIYNKNSNEPKIEPWGTPQVIVFLDDSCSLILHCCSLFDKYDSNHFSSMLEISKRFFILFRRIPWFIESNAFLISRKMMPFNFPSSIFSSHSSHIWMRAVTVKCFGRKPDWNFDNMQFSVR